MMNSFKLIVAVALLAAAAAYSGLVDRVFRTDEAALGSSEAQGLVLAAATSTIIPNAGRISELAGAAKLPDPVQSAPIAPKPEATARAEDAESLKQVIERMAARHGIELSGADVIEGDAPAAREGGLRTRLAALLAGYNHIMVNGDDGAVSRIVVVSAKDHKVPPRGTVAIVRQEREPVVRVASVEQVPMVQQVAFVQQSAAVERKPVTRRFLVYFDFDSAGMSSHARRTVGEALDYVRALESAEVDLVGYADRAGTERHNLKLSAKRANAVAAVLGRRLGGDKTVAVRAFGERNTAVPTPDGVAEPLNRRVEIVVRA